MERAGLDGNNGKSAERMAVKKHKLEPKRLRFCFETTYGPEGRGFESLTAYQKSSKSSDFEDFCFS